MLWLLIFTAYNIKLWFMHRYYDNYMIFSVWFMVFKGKIKHLIFYLNVFIAFIKETYIYMYITLSLRAFIRTLILHHGVKKVLKKTFLSSEKNCFRFWKEPFWALKRTVLGSEKNRFRPKKGTEGRWRKEKKTSKTIIILIEANFA